MLKETSKIEIQKEKKSVNKMGSLARRLTSDYFSMLFSGLHLPGLFRQIVFFPQYMSEVCAVAVKVYEFYSEDCIVY